MTEATDPTPEATPAATFVAVAVATFATYAEDVRQGGRIPTEGADAIATALAAVKGGKAARLAALAAATEAVTATADAAPDEDTADAIELAWGRVNRAMAKAATEAKAGPAPVSNVARTLAALHAIDEARAMVLALAVGFGGVTPDEVASIEATLASVRDGSAEAPALRDDAVAGITAKALGKGGTGQPRGPRGLDSDNPRASHALIVTGCAALGDGVHRSGAVAKAAACGSGQLDRVHSRAMAGEADLVAWLAARGVTATRDEGAGAWQYATPAS